MNFTHFSEIHTSASRCTRLSINTIGFSPKLECIKCCSRITYRARVIFRRMGRHYRQCTALTPIIKMVI